LTAQSLNVSDLSKFFRDSALTAAARLVDMAYPIVSIPFLLATLGVGDYAVLIAAIALVSPLQPVLNLAIDDVFQKIQLENGLDKAFHYLRILIRVRYVFLTLFTFVSMAFGKYLITLAILSLVPEIYSSHTYFIASRQIRYYLLGKIAHKLSLLMAIIFVLPLSVSIENYFYLLILSNLGFSALLIIRIQAHKDIAPVTLRSMLDYAPVITNSFYLVANNFISNIRDKYPIVIVSAVSPSLAVSLDIIHKGILAINSISSAFVLTAFATMKSLIEIYQFRSILIYFTLASLAGAVLFMSFPNASYQMGDYEIKASFASLAIVASTFYLYSIILVKTYMIPRNLYIWIVAISVLLAAASNALAIAFASSATVLFLPLFVFGFEFALRSAVSAWDSARQ
jgi:hypothetical protein